MPFLAPQRLILAAAIFASGIARAANSATQTVTFSVVAVNELSVAGQPGAMTVVTATAGAEPNPVTEASTRYAFTTNGTDRKITAMLNDPLPEGVVLRARLAAPAGATSAGTVALGTTPVDLVTGISMLNEGDKEIVYELSARANAGAVAAQTRTVTFTITAGAM